MATQDELNREKERLRLFEEKLKSETESFRIQKDSYEYSKGNLDIAYESLAALRESLGIRTSVRDLDRDIFKNARAIKNQLLGQGGSLANIREYRKDTLKNEKLLLQSYGLEKAALRELDDTQKGSIENAVVTANARKDALREEENAINKVIKQREKINKLEKDGITDPNKFDTELKALEALEIDLSQQQLAVAGLDTQMDELLEGELSNQKVRAAFYAKFNTQQLEGTQKVRKEAQKLIEPTSNFLSLLGAIPGFSNVATKALDIMVSKLDEQIDQQGKSVDLEKAKKIAIKDGLKDLKSQVFSTKVLAGILATGILRSFYQISKAQTDFIRLTGENARRFSLNNDTLSTTVELIETQVRLTEQFGLNAKTLFPRSTIKTASELTKAIGLSAEASGRFAQFSKITDTNLDESLDALTQSVPKAFSQKQILEETANVSSDIAVSLGTSTEEIGDAVIKAKQLGLTLQQVNDIAGSLLDIESSIAAEFEAEVITGKQLNLERARFFALTNDLAGLTDEIANNQEVISSFANANRIEQEAIAGALGMSRQQMADMVLQSDLISTLSDEQRANVGNVTLEQLKQIDAQTALADSFAKLTQTLTPIVRALTDILNGILKSTDYVIALAAGWQLVSKWTAISNAYLAINAKRQLLINAIQKKGLLLGIKDMAIEAYKSVVKTPYIGPILGAAAAAGALALGKTFLMDDVMFPGGYGKRVLSAPEGTFALNDNDTVIAGTNLNRRDAKTVNTISPSPIETISPSIRDRNVSTTATISESDMNRLINGVANAVMEGAEKGTSRARINFPLSEAANRIQPSLAVNTRRHPV